MWQKKGGKNECIVLVIATSHLAVKKERTKLLSGNFIYDHKRSTAPENTISVTPVSRVTLIHINH
jgi:hypothetical protein